MANTCNFNANNVQGSNCVGMRKSSNKFQSPSQHIDPANQNVGNLLLPNPQVSSSNPVLLGYQNSSFPGIYSSPGLNNSLSGYENNMQWLTDTRMTNQHNQLTCSVMTDKSLNSSAHALPPVTSHSCCVNRFGVLDTLGIGSPLPDQVKPSCDITSYQNKSMNIIDPIQSWLNLQIPPSNQQYCKFNDRTVTNQNYNIPVSIPSQINIPTLDQSDLRQNDMTIPNPDQCFEHVNTIKQAERYTNNIKSNVYAPENKHIMGQTVHDNSIVGSKPESSNFQSKEWKTTYQTMTNYIPSPNVFGNENQENLLFPQFGVPSSKLYYPSLDNYQSIISKNSNTNDTCSNQTNIDGLTEINRTMAGHEISNEQVSKINSQITLNENSHYHSKQVEEIRTDQATFKNDDRNLTFNNTQNLENNLSDCCQPEITRELRKSMVEIEKFPVATTSEEGTANGTVYAHTTITLENIDANPNSNQRKFRTPEAESSDTDESNIIVEESDDVGEIESEISMEEIKKGYQENEPNGNEVQLQCLICNSATSSKISANQFIHLNDSFPLITVSKTPVSSKLQEILPMDIQQYLKLHNSFLCRRCLNLIEAVEVLEIKLKSAKKTISDHFLRTLNLIAPEQQRPPGSLKMKTSVVNETNSEPSKTDDISVIHDETEQLLEKIETQDCNEPDSDIDETKEDLYEFKCGYCHKQLSSQTRLNQHIQSHTNEFNFYCEKCGKGFSLKYSLERHLLWHSGLSKETKILCDKCGDVFHSKDSFICHNVKCHSEEFKFKCETCGKGFTRKVSLEIHSATHTGIRQFMCEFCGFTFTTKANLSSHLNICVKEDHPIRCDLCGRGFASESHLHRHKSQLHRRVNKLACTICEKEFNKPYNLNRHMLSHSSEKTFKCIDCDKSFKTESNLNHHAKIDHMEKQILKCRVCAKTFSHKTGLNDHMNTHNNETPYKCTKCDKSFTHQTTFLTHLKNHSEKVRGKTCEKCGKVILTRMSVHMRTHTGEKPYQCSFCPMAFSVGRSLKKHIQAKHETHLRTA